MDEVLKSRVLALDVGKKRVGLAVSDPLGITAQGLPTLARTTIREDIQRLGELAAEWGVSLFLVGAPYHLSGNDSRQTIYTREFAAKLEQRTGIPVQFWDERLTTVQAQRVLRESGVSLEKRNAAVDQMAAVILLSSYLDAQAIAGGQP